MLRIKHLSLLIPPIWGLPGCSGDTEAASPVLDRVACKSVALPLNSGSAAPTLASLTLNCEADSVVPELVLSDPEGTADLRNVPQRVEAFTDLACSSDVIAVEDDVVAAGEPEWFGTLIDRSRDPSLYASVCASTSWPVRVHLRDATGNLTVAVVEAPVLHE